MIDGRVPDIGYEKLNLLEFEGISNWARIFEAISDCHTLDICGNAIQQTIANRKEKVEKMKIVREKKAVI